MLDVLREWRRTGRLAACDSLARDILSPWSRAKDGLEMEEVVGRADRALEAAILLRHGWDVPWTRQYLQALTGHDSADVSQAARETLRLLDSAADSDR